MRDFLGIHTVYHDQIPLSTYYLMYVPYSRYSVNTHCLFAHGSRGHI